MLLGIRMLQVASGEIREDCVMGHGSLVHQKSTGEGKKPAWRLPLPLLDRNGWSSRSQENHQKAKFPPSISAKPPNPAVQTCLSSLEGTGIYVQIIIRIIKDLGPFLLIVSKKRRRDDRAALEQADEIRADFMANEQKVPRDMIGHRLQAFTGFHLGLQIIRSYLDAGCYEKAAEWTDRLQLRAEIGIVATHQLASEPRVGLTAADHCFNNIIDTRVPKGKKAEALVRKQKVWALLTARVAIAVVADRAAAATGVAASVEVMTTVEVVMQSAMIAVIAMAMATAAAKLGVEALSRSGLVEDVQRRNTSQFKGQHLLGQPCGPPAAAPDDMPAPKQPAPGPVPARRPNLDPAPVPASLATHRKQPARSAVAPEVWAARQLPRSIYDTLGEVVTLYLLSLLNSSKEDKVGPGQVRTASAAISSYFRLVGRAPPTEHPACSIIRDLAEKQLQGRKLEHDALEPADITVLARLVGGLEPPLDQLMTVTAITVMFTGFFRFDNAAEISVHEDLLVITAAGMDVFIPRSKTDQQRQGHWVPIAHVGGAACPVGLMERLLTLGRYKRRPDTPDEDVGPLLWPVQWNRAGRYLSGPLTGTAAQPIHSLSYPAFCHRLNKTLQAAGITRCITAHSMRIGGNSTSSTAADRGVPADLHKAHGRWRSDTMVQHYTWRDGEAKLSVSRSLGLASEQMSLRSAV
ncbi:hypothetical protein VOLCADRAFT_100577 [Volvox carteri f. nagariensis]|uniref:Tyr recombinase domain-containing protein n=1 Tax=Volvox carteri f. nagariensis TaxID=3068 RepID=D8UKJ1_VOLCA|nr:uncharacterized protein VOLCADRAFT_100577 [Volvox carteri f. nagariensis]EFJ39760.1 hypothetical protein VOLCADRAFT_100577 [Volvox carteri f. nagariensis]|eukprot:XP_002959170.1 hypothetical protein VOLCADRAFT_100577 [Volvox carteri f. nagariensis]